MKLSGSLLALGVVLSLFGGARAAASGLQTRFQPGSAGLGPRVMAPSSALFSRSPSVVTAAKGARAVPLANGYRIRGPVANVSPVGRTPKFERTAQVPLNRFGSGQKAASTGAPVRPMWSAPMTLRPAKGR